MTSALPGLVPAPPAGALLHGIDPAALLVLMQWLSPAFPTGAFAYSHGMETAIQAGELPDAGAVAGWIGDVLEWGAGWGDAVILAHALAPGADHAGLADLACALAPTAERLAETTWQGAAFDRALPGPPPEALPPPQALPLPVAFGRAAGALALPPSLVIAAFLQAFAANLVAVAVRFVPLGQNQGQRILEALRPTVLRLAGAAAAAPLAAIATAAIRADIASARHETLTVRMFRT